jgi:hypothetical protein
LVNQIPQRIIFAYDGDSLESINKTCKMYYDYCKKIGIVEPMPDYIMVNNEYYIARAGLRGQKIHTGETIPYGQYTKIEKKSDPNVGGMALFNLIYRIMTVSNLSPHMQIDFDEYSRKIDETLIALANQNNNNQKNKTAKDINENVDQLVKGRLSERGSCDLIIPFLHFYTTKLLVKMNIPSTMSTNGNMICPILRNRAAISG